MPFKFDHNDLTPEDKDQIAREIQKMHPLITGNHRRHHISLELVHDRESKAAIAALVTYLLGRIDRAENTLKDLKCEPFWVGQQKLPVSCVCYNLSGFLPNGKDKIITAGPWHQLDCPRHTE